jgi:hypothetical protein
MSAYLCNPEDFALLAAYALKPGAPRHFVNLDQKEYIDVEDRCRHRHDTCQREHQVSRGRSTLSTALPVAFLCGTLEEFLAEVKLAAKARYDYNDLVKIKEVLHCFDYQSCEHPEYRQSDAYHLVRCIKDQLLDEFADRYELMQRAA